VLTWSSPPRSAKATNAPNTRPQLSGRSSRTRGRVNQSREPPSPVSLRDGAHVDLTPAPAGAMVAPGKSSPFWPKGGAVPAPSSHLGASLFRPLFWPLPHPAQRLGVACITFGSHYTALCEDRQGQTETLGANCVGEAESPSRPGPVASWGKCPRAKGQRASQGLHLSASLAKPC